MYEIRYDAAARLLFYRMEGFWTLDTVARFVADLQAATASIRGTPLRFDALCDSTNFPVQSHEVSDALGRVMKAGTKLRTGRTAIAVASTLNKLQAQRALPHPSVRVFLSMDEARAWLQTPETDH